MKSELITAIFAAVVGVLVAYFVCNIFIGEINPVTFKTVNNDVSADLDSPDPEVFNYRALNPTVEIYIGNCTNYDSAGNCIEDSAGGQSSDSEANQENP